MEAVATAASMTWGCGEVPSTSGSLESGAHEDSESVPMEGVLDDMQDLEMEDMTAQATALRLSSRSNCREAGCLGRVLRVEAGCLAGTSREAGA